MSKKFWLIASLVGVFLIIGIIVISEIVNKNDLSDTRLINSIVTVTNTEISVKNNNTYDWKDVQITINENFVFSQDGIRSGETKLFQISDFANESGLRFNPKEFKVINVVVATHMLAISVSYDDFQKQKNIVQDINVSNGETITVTLFSNATTGYKWEENTQISDSQVLQQIDHKYVAPGNTGGKVGVGGAEVWSFKALKAGTSTIYTEYSQPWEKGTKGTWTFKLKVTVK
jgi:inhibitor of cysteine peptidase